MIAVQVMANEVAVGFGRRWRLSGNERLHSMTVISAHAVFRSGWVRTNEKR